MNHKIKSCAFASILFFTACFVSDQAYAGTRTTVLPGFADLTYPDSVKLKNKGCQEIKFSYVVDESLPLVNTAFIVQLVHKTKKIMYGYSYWFSDISTTDGLPSMSRQQLHIQRAGIPMTGHQNHKINLELYIA
jgi:hypothetical protein